MIENIPLQHNEEIVPIQGYKDLYSITNFGRVWSHRRYKGRRWYGGCFLKLLNKRGNYLGVGLYNNKEFKNYTIQVLTAQHFIPNPQNLPEVNHKDGNKQNNFAGTRENNYTDGNLEWSTSQENHNHAVVNGLKCKRHSKFYGVTYHIGLCQKKKPWEVQLYIDRKHVHIGYFKTEIEAAQAYNDYVIEHELNRPLNRIEGD